MMNRIVKILLILFLVGDAAYSFIQFCHFPLDGDMATLILPDQWHEQVFQDPFGFNALIHGERYSGTNRYFCYWTLSNYFYSVPLWLQTFLSPIESVYVACAIAKLLVQFFILFLLSWYAAASFRLSQSQWLVAAAIITPLFQTCGFYFTLGIIDHSTTYVFFYALPIAFLLLFFLPFYLKEFVNPALKFTWLLHGLLISLLLVVSFSCPLNAPVMLIAGMIILIVSWSQQMKKLMNEKFTSRIFKSIVCIPPHTLIYFSLAIAISAYSIYIGTFDIENSDALSLAKGYSLLLSGLWKFLYECSGLSVLLLMILINVIFICRLPPLGEKKKLWYQLRLIACFSVIYILLLPLGGYRFYRPHIIRNDTMIPVTLVWIFFFARSSIFLIQQKETLMRKAHLALLLIFLLLLTRIDEPAGHLNDCEKEQLQKLSSTTEKVVELDGSCYILQWVKITDPDKSYSNARLIKMWHITKEEVHYFQK